MIHVQVAELLGEEGCIQPSLSLSGAPTLFVGKEDAAFCVVVDYHVFDKKANIHVPRVNDLLEKLGRGEGESSSHEFIPVMLLLVWQIINPKKEDVTYVPVENVSLRDHMW